MLRKLAVLALLCLVLSVTGAFAQDPKLGLIFNDIYGPGGLKVDSLVDLSPGVTHSAHFNNGFQSSFRLFNIALASQLTAVPLPSPASSFTYTYDSASGAFARSTQSFGPILADRSETIGRRKFSVSFNYQRFTFNSIEGLDLDAVPAVFTHDQPDAGGRLDVVSTQNSIDASIAQSTAFFNYGLTDRLDASIAVPIVRTSLSLRSDATLYRLGTAGQDPRIHFFDNNGQFGTFKSFTSEGSKTGLGDLIFRLKSSALRRENMGLAVGIDFRAPTGDEENLLGSGAPGVKPFAALSYSFKRIAPHVNLGYQWNGNSVLAGDVATQTKGDLPDQFLYTLGFDVGATDKVTLAFDILGQRVLDSPELVQSDDLFRTAAGSTQSLPNIRFDENRSFNIINGAVGAKFNVAEHFLVGFNLLFKLNDSGLRDKVTPLFGIEYSR